MNPERWQRVEELFLTVADRPAAEREAYLTRVCGGDEELRHEVLSLLARDTTEDFIEKPIAGVAVSLSPEPGDDAAGKRIGPYRLTRLVGRGGMGAVYEAVRDDDQFQQQVAIKLIRGGMDSDFVRDRFVRERQILASLDHPHIARLFDGGATEDGRPYFVMEFVDGEPITDYCRQRKLSLDEKLKLFRDVCSAVQHAHQKLVVHRDLKPSNIMVTPASDGKAGTLKLLDFGIAKLLAPDPGEAVTRTATAVRLMTPDYASPEQVRGGAITTATDVYALGVVLYELLTTRRPYQFETYSPVEIERAICDTEAPRPSEAARQQTDTPAKLARQLVGDLDNIVPGEYCNITPIHLIPQRNRRLWVIAAGVYWQLMVGTFNLLAWFLLAPHTLLSDTAFIFVLGSVLDVLFNANPLIKLDGYYFLSQWLRLPNLMDRSRAYWRGVLKRMLFGERNSEAVRYDRRERTIYLVFGLLSFTYNVAFASVIVVYVGDWLIERFYLLGLALAVGVALLFLRRPLKQMIKALVSNRWYGTGSGSDRVHPVSRIPGNPVATAPGTVPLSTENKMADNNQTTTQVANKDARPPFWRRRLAPLALALVAIVLLLMPWTASVGNYGTLIAIPDQETIIRAPESASLVALGVRPGDQIAGGAVIGQMGNYDLEEQIVQAQSELARASADYDRLSGELRTRQEAAIRADTQLRQRQRDYDEIETERRQIAERQQFEKGGARIVAASSPGDHQLDQASARYPAALAVLQAEVDSCRAQLEEATAQRDRARKLNAEGIAPRSELDAAKTRASTLGSALAAARQRLEAALVEHRRKHTSTTTEMSLANSDLSAERLQIAKLGSELNAMREVIATLEARRSLLQKKRAQFELVTPRAGAVFGEDLPREVGTYFQKGAEICRVADTHQLLLRVNVPEREIGDVRAGHPVRLKVRAFPDRTFRGVVSKIAGESEPDQNGQASYRVELTIENADGTLRPGMTAFARIDFDRRAVGSILLRKIKQALRPELWML